MTQHSTSNPNAPIENTIEVQNVSKRFWSKQVLFDVSFNVPKGVVFALLGENGAGKSTLIRSMIGYHSIQKGTIRVLGLDPYRKAFQVRQRIGYVADAPALHEWMTVKQIAWFASGFYPDGYAGRFVELAKGFSLPTDQRIKSLSKGMRSKLALALSMAADPELLILDEPTSGLDPVVRRTFLESMVDWTAQGKTVLLASHQVAEVERVADWVAILHAGRMRVVAKLEDLKQSVRVISFSLHDPFVLPPESVLNLQVLRYASMARNVQMTVENWTDELEAHLKSESGVMDLQIVRPSLEELYIAYATDPILPPWHSRDHEDRFRKSTQVA